MNFFRARLVVRNVRCVCGRVSVLVGELTGED